MLGFKATADLATKRKEAAMANKLLNKIYLFILTISLLAGCSSAEVQDTINNEIPSQPRVETEDIQTEKTGTNLEVHFVDVGQADCIFLESDGQYMLIDAGNNDDSDFIVDYLSREGVEKLDYVFGTHPHEDHIGSLDTVINTFDIGAVYMPKKVHTSKTFEDVLDAVSDKGLTITMPVPGTILDFNGISVEILAPVKEYDELNNNSIVLKVTNGDISFLFTGDAEAEAETETDILDEGFDLDADILKVGHHGSDTSTTDAFLAAVSPEIAVISVGEDNSYGHPDAVTIDKLQERNIEIYRTDLNGTVKVITDGESIDVQYEKDNTTAQQSINEISRDNTTNEVYIGNLNSMKFHRSSCSSLPAEKNRIYFDNKDEAVNKGYVACKRCNP